MLHDLDRFNTLLFELKLLPEVVIFCWVLLVSRIFFTFLLIKVDSPPSELSVPLGEVESNGLIVEVNHLDGDGHKVEDYDAKHRVPV